MFEEPVINVKFAELLSTYGIESYPQVLLPRQKKPDILVFIDGIRVIFEGRTTKNLRKLKEDAIRRLQDGLCEASVALFYDPDLKLSSDLRVLENNLLNCFYDGSVFYLLNGKIEEQVFNRYKIFEIADILKNIISLLVSQDKVKDIVKKIEDEFQGLFKLFGSYSLWIDSEKSKALIKRLQSILGITQTFQNLEAKRDLFYITLFLLFDALLFHELIADVEPVIVKISQKDETNGFRIFLLNEWKKILNIDYKPIFDLAYEILKNFPTSEDIDFLLFKIKDLVLQVLSTGVLRSHDLMGRIYHKLLLKTTGKYYATYYTALPSAVLLSNLILRKVVLSDRRDGFADERFLNEFKLIDPACGSGTLLSSSFKVLKDIFSSFLDVNKMKDFYKKMIEEKIYGIDILDYAAHLTLVTLMQHSPEVKIDGSNIYVAPFGKINGEIELGSLSILKSFFSKGSLQRNPQQLPMVFKAKSFVKNIDREELRVIELEIKPEDFDVVIMNPPFSRSAGSVNVRYGYVDESVRKEMQKEEKKVLERLGFRGIGHAGLGASFIVLADKLLKNNGVMGIVIPRAILSSVSWGIIRDYLMKHYEIKFIISNHDPGDDVVEGWNWSENTDLGEVMVVIQKNEKPLEEKETIYINLWNKPQNEIQALDYVFKIKPESLDGCLNEGRFCIIKSNTKEVGAFYKVRQKALEKNWLYPCLFANPLLNQLTFGILDQLQGIELKYLVEVKEMNNKLVYLAGLDRRQVEDLFEKVNIESSHKGIWGQPEWLSEISPVTLDNFKPKKEIISDRYFHEYASDLLFAERIWTNNTRVLSVLTDIPVITTLFWEVKFKEEYKKYKSIFALWFNSTYGLIEYLSFCINNGGPWFNMKKENLLNLLIPDFIFNQDINEFNAFFDSIKNQKFAPLPEEFNLSVLREGVRYKIDKFFKDKENSLLDLDNYYGLFAKEPIFTLKRL